MLIVVALDFFHAIAYSRHQSMTVCIARCWKCVIICAILKMCVRRLSKLRGKNKTNNKLPIRSRVWYLMINIVN